MASKNTNSVFAALLQSAAVQSGPKQSNYMLDADVKTAIAAVKARTGLKFSPLVNALLRAGLAALEEEQAASAPTPARKTKPKTKLAMEQPAAE